MQYISCVSENSSTYGCTVSGDLCRAALSLAAFQRRTRTKKLERNALQGIHVQELTSDARHHHHAHHEMLGRTTADDLIEDEDEEPPLVKACRLMCVER